MSFYLKKYFMLAALVSSGVLCAEANNTAATNNVKQIESIVHNYLINNPEILVEVSQKLQQKRQNEITAKSESAINSNAKDIFASNALAQAGNAKANVTLVEFFDYQCLHCKHMAPVISNVLKKNSNVRVIYKELPIFGKSSEYASQAALAAAKQGKYNEMHHALLEKKGHLTTEYISNVAKKIGLNIEQFQKDSASEEIKKQISSNKELAEKLHLMGTPAFIIAYTPAGEFKEGNKSFFIPGSTTEEALMNFINKASAKSS